MRTPSLYSQDDPISEALRPPVTETEAERIARLSAEADAKRISDKIDEDLREERERLRRKKGDVKVGWCLPYLLFDAHILTFLAAPAPWSGGEWEIDPPKAVSTHV
jgi:hypothetical protein